MIRTRVALHLLGENLYFGHRALADLLGGETLTGLTAMAITGRRPGPDERAVLDAVSVVMCSADPRIWPLKLARLVSSFGGTIAGYAAGHLVLEGDQIGPWVVGFAARELVAMREELGGRLDDADAVNDAAARRASRPRLLGYGVPLRARDERMEALRAHVAKLGRDRMPYWTLQEALSAAVMRAGRTAPNVGIGLAAVLLDLGYTPVQSSALSMFLNQNVFAANAFEAAGQRDPDMQRLPDSCVDYRGPARRASPRAARAVDDPRPR